MSKESMNKKYASPDPFGVKTDPADVTRKGKILSALNDILGMRPEEGARFKRALDIGCGEGHITTDLPADEITGFDISDIALSRCPENMVVVDDPANIRGEFDLIICTGSLVRDYDFGQILALIHKHACGIVLTCQTDITEVQEVATLTNQTHLEEFPYRDLKQTLRIFDYSEVDDKQVPKADDENPVTANSDVTYSGETEQFTGTVEEIGAKIAGNHNEMAVEKFKELVDEAILALPTDRGFNAIVLNASNRSNLFDPDSNASHYQGYRIIEDEKETYFRFDHIDEESEAKDSDGGTDDGIGLSHEDYQEMQKEADEEHGSPGENEDKPGETANL